MIAQVPSLLISRTRPLSNPIKSTISFAARSQKSADPIALCSTRVTAPSQRAS